MTGTERVLVVGGNGFIGSHVVDRLLVEGCGVRILGRKEHRMHRLPKRVDFHIGECGQEQVVRSVAKDCTIIVYLAHHATPVSSAREPMDALTLSITPFVDFLRFLDWSEVKLFMYVSTGGAIYGNVPRGLASEATLPHPLSSYGVSKLAMESYLRMFVHQTGRPCMILRPSNVYGPRQNYLGDHGLVSVALYRFLTEQPLHIWGQGRAVKDYLFVEDMAEGVVALMNKGKPGQVYNLGCEQGTQVREILDLAHQLTGKQGQIVYESRQSYDVKRVVLNCAKIKSQTGWRAKVGLEEGMARTLDWLRSDLPRTCHSRKKT